jgi:deoxycytidylate deaminase
MATKAVSVANDTKAPEQNDVSPVSKELVIGLVSHAGAGCSTAGRRIQVLLEDAGYEVVLLKVSDLILTVTQAQVPELKDGAQAGASKFARASALQDLGDKLREKHHGYALAATAVRKIKEVRGGETPGHKRLAFILDSLKHPEEVNLLRQVYDQSFRLVAVHCEPPQREARLIGDKKSVAKYAGVPKDDVLAFMKRDEKDDSHSFGQRVRDVFHLADFFLDNTAESHEGSAMNSDIDRFINLLLDRGLVRPTTGERAIYHAYAAALQSSCLSRQVGAALVSSDGSLVATGTNDPPKFGGGVYDEDSDPDHRCFKWDFTDGKISFRGCHNDRKKDQLYKKMAEALAEPLAAALAQKLVPPNIVVGNDLAAKERSSLRDKLKAAIPDTADILRNVPGLRDITEFSRSIHAEMAALMSAVRSGANPVGGSVYVTTYPCHNCARHLVAAGISFVYFIEPYVKSLATELHSDSIATELPPLKAGVTGKRESPTRMVMVPFTGVGPRMYEDFFVKRGEMKALGGAFNPSDGGTPFYAVRLRELEGVESEAAKLLPETVDV